LAIFAFLAPIIASAAFELDTNFPSAPGTNETITGRTKLPEFIRYFVDWSIIIAAILIVASLVYTGIMYLTSRGRPSAMQNARRGLEKGLLGLIILLGSYLVLQTVNPDLTIITIMSKPVGSGIVLFTEAGLYGSGEKDLCYEVYSKIAATNERTCNSASKVPCYNPYAVHGFNTANGDALNDLIKNGVARQLGGDITDAQAIWGGFAQETNFGGGGAYFNFVDFPIYAIGFWGDETTTGGKYVRSVHIFAYNSPNFFQAGDNKNPIEYTWEGKIGTDGKAIEATGGMPSCRILTSNSPASQAQMKITAMEDKNWEEFKSLISYYKGDLGGGEKTITLIDYYKATPALRDKFQKVNDTVAHAPQSLRLEGKGPGVILYSNEAGIKHFSYSAEDFSLSNVNFDNKADFIEISNPRDKEGKKQNDFLVIAHAGPFFSGDLRIFFERKFDSDFRINSVDYPAFPVPNIYFAGESFKKPDMKELECDSGFYKNEKTAIYCGDPTDSAACKPANQPNSDNKCVVDTTEFAIGEPMAFLAADDYYYEPYSGVSAIIGVYPYSVSATARPLPLGPNPEVYNPKVPLNDKNINPLQERMGRMGDGDKMSSLEIFELEDQYVNIARKEKIVCREVKLCTGKGRLGDCLSFVPNHSDFLENKFSGRENTIVLPMPLFVPVNIPKEIKGGLMKVQAETDTSETKIEMQRKDVKFADHIKSLFIDGDCAVVLFENSIDDIEKCEKCCFLSSAGVPSTNLPTDYGATCKKNACKKCWNGGPGSHSEVFTQSDNDLTNNQISECGGKERFGFGEKKNCASAIAIFPIKK